MKTESNHHDLEASFISLLKNELNEDARMELMTLINSSPEIEAEFLSTKEMWSTLELVSVPESSPEMKASFNEMLENFKEESAAENRFHFSSIIKTIRGLFSYNPSFNWAYAMLILIAGGFIGFFTGKSGSENLATNQEIERLGSEVQQMKQMMMISMLDNPVASERMKAVSYTQEITNANGQVIEALLATFNQDENVNVRLVTLEALIELSESPKVREGLVLSLLKQESPLVQVALADAMIHLQEKRSVKEIRELLGREDLNEMVKEKLEETITHLI